MRIDMQRLTGGDSISKMIDYPIDWQRLRDYKRYTGIVGDG
jgi:hypothetical protein